MGEGPKALFQKVSDLLKKCLKSILGALGGISFYTFSKSEKISLFKKVGLESKCKAGPGLHFELQESFFHFLKNDGVFPGLGQIGLTF